MLDGYMNKNCRADYIFPASALRLPKSLVVYEGREKGQKKEGEECEVVFLGLKCYL